MSLEVDDESEQICYHFGRPIWIDHFKGGKRTVRYANVNGYWCCWRHNKDGSKILTVSISSIRSRVVADVELDSIEQRVHEAVGECRARFPLTTLRYTSFAHAPNIFPGVMF